MSKAEKMRGRLASIQKDREEFERQRKELEADMNVSRTNMGKINKGLRNNAILEEPIVVDAHIGAHATPHHAHSSKPGSDRNQFPSSRNNPLGEHGTGANASSASVNGAVSGQITPTAASAAGMIFAAGSGANASNGTNSPAASHSSIMPSGPRISDWCYCAPLDSPAPPTVKSREMYENVRLLGRGSFGEVNLVKNVEDNKLFAIKTQLCPKDSEFQNVLREVRFLRASRHPCIIDVHDAFLMTNPRIVYIVMHYCESGTISSAISSAKKNKTTIAETQIIKWVLQLALAMQFLHENHVIHRDLKPMNVMLTEGGDSLKLADFGLAMSMSEKAEEEATDEAGTPYYTAPEMIAREPYSYPADCWSFGVIVHQLLALERPFDGNHTADLVKSILSNEPPPLPTHYSDEIKLISVELLRKDQNERLTMTELLLEPIFHSKLASFPQNYRPRTLEERIRRSHQKQLESQIENINRHRRTDGPKNLHEKVALRQQAQAEAAAAAAASAAALTPTDPTGAVSPVNGANAGGATPRNSVSRGSSSVNNANVSTRNNTPSGRSMAPSTSGIRLSNAEATAAQASAVAQSMSLSRNPSARLSVDFPATTTDTSSSTAAAVTALPSPEKSASPTDVAERTRSVPGFTPLPHTIPEETAQDIAQSMKLAAHAVTVEGNSSEQSAAHSNKSAASDTAAVGAGGGSDGSGTVPAREPSNRTLTSSSAKSASFTTAEGSPHPLALATQESRIDTIPNSPIKGSTLDREDSSTPYGGRKGQEIARAKETDQLYEAQLSAAVEVVTQATQPNSPNSKSTSFAAAAGDEAGAAVVTHTSAVSGKELDSST